MPVTRNYVGGVGSYFDYQFSAATTQDDNYIYRWVKVGGQIPQGVWLLGGGLGEYQNNTVFKGTPTVSGEYACSLEYQKSPLIWNTFTQPPITVLDTGTASFSIRAGRSFQLQKGQSIEIPLPELAITGVVGLSYQLTAGTLPPGMAFYDYVSGNGTGGIKFYGSPSSVGSYSCGILCSWTGGLNGPGSFLLNYEFLILAPPLIDSGQIFAGKVGEPFQATLAASDGPATSWSATGLPAGLMINAATGAISGTPTAKGSYTASVTASGVGGTSPVQSVVFTISEGTPIIAAGQSFSGKVGVALSATPALTDATNRPATSWTATGLPAGLAINGTTGAITGTPTAKGNFTCSLTATGPGGTDTKTATITITEGPPSIAAGQSFSAFKREIFNASIALEDATNRPATAWNASGLPSGLSIHSITGHITGTPVGLVGIYSVIITASGPGGEAEAVEIQIEVVSREIESIVQLRAVPAASGLPTMPTNEVCLRGGVYVFARWTRRGAIPLGLNWSGGPEGLKFWGTPIAAGLYEAEFEGPFPENYRSHLTQGGAWDEPALLGGSVTEESSGAEKFYVIFEVSEVAASMRTFGEVYGQLGAATSLRARRPAWPEGLQIGFLPPQATLGSSDSPVEADTLVSSNEEFSLADLLAFDWQLTTAAQPAPQNCLLTAKEVPQTIAPATEERGAVFLGSEIDGRARRVIANTKIPLAESGNFLFGEFHLAATFQGKVHVRLWFTRNGVPAFLSAGECFFGLKMFQAVHPLGHEEYRNPSNSPDDYTLTLESQSIPLLTGEIETSVRYGIFNLSTPEIPSGITVAHLIVTATKV